MAENILVVDDEREIADLVEVYLQNEGYTVYKFYNAGDALNCLETTPISLAVLDIMLPDMDGFALCRRIRQKFYFPIIMLTAKVEDLDKIMGLTVGADDYITKPFEIQEVLARIQVQLRHMQQEPEHKSVSYKNLELDRERFEVRIAGVLLPKITKQEFAILELLLEHPKQVFSKEEIFEYAWDEHYMGETKTLDVHISNIRKKIKAVTQEEYIDTVWGIGYRLHS